jgi:hypothetical protein
MTRAHGRIEGLPPLDTPQWQRDPHSCLSCAHLYQTHARENSGDYYCRRTRTRCRFERHETGECKPEALHWERSTWKAAP